MYNVYNKSDVYYVFNRQRNVYVLIGNYRELLVYLSKGFKSKLCYKENYNIAYYNNCFFDDINMGNDYSHYIYKRYEENEEGFSYIVKTEYFDEKSYLFIDGFDRIIDVRLFRDEAFKVYLQRINEKKRYYYRRYKKHNGRKRHSHNTFRNHIGNKKRVLTIDNIFDTEYKEYHFKHLEDFVNPYPDWWDDTYRRVEGNWKSQYKVNRQYNIHNKGKNNKSIRKDFSFEEFSLEEIDEMLLEDFLDN